MITRDVPAWYGGAVRTAFRLPWRLCASSPLIPIARAVRFGDDKARIFVRTAIISDIHGNLTALEAVLADLQITAPDLILHGGDLADNGSSPVEVVDMLQSAGWQGVVGNTDEMLSTPAYRFLAAAEDPEAAERIRQSPFPPDRHVWQAQASLGPEPALGLSPPLHLVPTSSQPQPGANRNKRVRAAPLETMFAPARSP